MANERRKGFVRFSRQKLFDYDEAARIMTGLVVWRSDVNFITDQITLWGEHRDFDLISEGETMPEYEAIVMENSVTWRRVQ